MGVLPFIDGELLMSLVGRDGALRAVEGALAGGAGRAGPGRTGVPTAAGELLLMPAQSSTAVGVKLVGVAPGNPAAGLPRIQAVYVLFDAATLTPRALVDGTALTALRTPAVSALAVRRLAAPGAVSLVVFGSGPQAWGHVQALRGVRPVRSVTVVGRDRGRAGELADRLRADGLTAEVGEAGAVAGADVVVCATSARSPLFDGRLLPQHTCVVAVGSHEPAARELDDEVFRRASHVVVEDRATALREAGDVIQAAASGALDPGSLTELGDLHAPVPPAGSGCSRASAWAARTSRSPRPRTPPGSVRRFRARRFEPAGEHAEHGGKAGRPGGPEGLRDHPMAAARHRDRHAGSRRKSAPGRRPRPGEPTSSRVPGGRSHRISNCPFSPVPGRGRSPARRHSAT